MVGRRNAKPRCGDAIDNQRHGEAAGLLIGGHIGQLRQLLHFVHEAAGPEVQLVRVRVLQRVLVLLLACGLLGRPP